MSVLPYRWSISGSSLVVIGRHRLSLAVIGSHRFSDVPVLGCGQPGHDFKSEPLLLLESRECLDLPRQFRQFCSPDSY